MYYIYVYVCRSSDLITVAFLLWYGPCALNLNKFNYLRLNRAG